MNFENLIIVAFFGFIFWLVDRFILGCRIDMLWFQLLAMFQYNKAKKQIENSIEEQEGKIEQQKKKGKRTFFIDKDSLEASHHLLQSLKEMRKKYIRLKERYKYGDRKTRLAIVQDWYNYTHLFTDLDLKFSCFNSDDLDKEIIEQQEIERRFNKMLRIKK